MSKGLGIQNGGTFIFTMQSSNVFRSIETPGINPTLFSLFIADEKRFHNFAIATEKFPLFQ